MTLLKGLGYLIFGLLLVLGGFLGAARFSGESINYYNMLPNHGLGWHGPRAQALMASGHALDGPGSPGGTADAFAFYAPGNLAQGTGSGPQRGGTADWSVYVPQMAFPIRHSHSAWLNSQIYAPGGGGYRGRGPDNQCAVQNYSYPWRDNFCEKRPGTNRESLNCPSQQIHQGVDIRGGSGGWRGSSCYQMAWQGEQAMVPVVAAEDGRVEYSRAPYKYTLLLITDEGRVFRYLHLERTSLAVKPGTAVRKGETIGFVSNYFGRSQTTHHLHFEISQNVAGKGFSHVAPYMSLVRAYERDHGLTAVLVEEG
jgi:hypothetical protein